MARPYRVKVKIDTSAALETLEAVNAVMYSPDATREVQRGAEIMALAVRQRAPIRSGLLRKGVYTVSAVRDNFVALSRGNSRKVNTQLPHPPRRQGIALVTSSTFYGRFVEKGRKPRAADPTRANKHERRAVGKQGGRLRGKPFFQPAIRSSRPLAESYVQRRIDRLIQEKAGK